LRGYPSAVSRKSPACAPALSIALPGCTLATSKKLSSGTHPAFSGPQNSCRILKRKVSINTVATAYIHQGARHVSMDLRLQSDEANSTLQMDVWLTIPERSPKAAMRESHIPARSYVIVGVTSP